MKCERHLSCLRKKINNYVQFENNPARNIIQYRNIEYYT